jgi:hypothetical protein
MRNILTFAILIVSFSGFGQIQFKLYGYDSCAKAVKPINFFGLKKNGVVFKSNDTTGIIVLRDTGTYVLSNVLEYIDESQFGKKYLLNSKGDFSDTLRLITIHWCFEPTSRPNFVGYCCCGEKCEGAQTEYYANGNKRVEAFFKDGIPIGKLKFFDPKGKLILVKKYKRGKLIKTRGREVDI